MNELVLVFILITCSFLAGAAFSWLVFRLKKGSFQSIGDRILNNAKLEAESILQNADFKAKARLFEQNQEIEKLKQKNQEKLAIDQDRLKKREDALENRLEFIEKKLFELEERENRLNHGKQLLETEKSTVSHLKTKLERQLETNSGLTKQEAKEELKKELFDEIKQETAAYIIQKRKEAEEQADQFAQKVIATSINRLAVDCVSDHTVLNVPFKNDEIKRRIIGREGRNIRALERLTGINFVVDDAPGAITLSGFDPVRLHIAKTALTELVSDGRIHPTRIEEVVESAKQKVERKIMSYGEQAAIRCGQVNLDEYLIQLLGKLKFRFSYGQNVLEHSIEVSHIMGIMAEELGLNVQLAKRIGLLHDIGKAVTHEVDGTHAIIGHDYAFKYGESEAVANGIGCHHQEIDPITIEGSLCGSADALSASRPGARIEAVNEYVKRIKKLEELAYQFPGVDKAYALQAGREIRVAVLPDMIDDKGMIHLARDLTKKIEKQLHYPGKIKVTVIREKKAVEYAI